MAGGFTGFAAFAAPAPPPASPAGRGPREAATAAAAAVVAAASPVYNGADSALGAALKKLSKRDATTKLKALGDVCAMLAGAGGDAAGDVLPFWAHAYPRLCTDGDRRVRAAAQRVLGAIMAGARSRAGPYLPLLLPPWWLAAHDACDEAREGARGALDASFPPPARRARLLAATGAAVLAGLARYASAPGEEVVDARRMEPEVAADAVVRGGMQGEGYVCVCVVVAVWLYDCFFAFYVSACLRACAPASVRACAHFRAAPVFERFVPVRLRLPKFGCARGMP
jgi:hypothetical protein